MTQTLFAEPKLDSLAADFAEMSLADFPRGANLAHITDAKVTCELYVSHGGDFRHLVRGCQTLCNNWIASLRANGIIWGDASEVTCRHCLKEINRRANWLVDHALQATDIELTTESAMIARDYFEETGSPEAVRVLDIWLRVNENDA